METLSDMVFGLALSLGALGLIVQLPADPNALYAALGVFAFSFMILVMVWYSYKSIMTVLPLETQGVLLLNLVLLLAVAIEPYLLTVFSFGILGAVREIASVLYALDLAAMNGILGGFMHILSKEKKPLPTPGLARTMRTRRNFTWGSAAVFLLTALPFFWTWMWFPGVPGRVVIWILCLPVAWIVRARTR